MIKNLVRIGTGVMTTILVLLVLWQFRVVVGYALISLMLAASLKSLFARLAGKKLISKIFLGFTYILMVFILLLILFFSVRAAASELSNLAQISSEQEDWGLPLWINTSELTILLWMPPPSVFFEAIIGPDGEMALPTLLEIVQNIGVILTASVVILILSIYWSARQVHYERLWLSLIPPNQRKRARNIWLTIETEIGAYIRGRVLFSLLVGVCLGFGSWIIGSPFPALLGLIGSLASLIPFMGGLLIIISTLVIGLLTRTGISSATLIYTFIVFLGIQIWIKPRLFERRWDNPILTVILMIGLAYTFGIFGIIIAPPISAICLILWDRLIIHRVAADGGTDISDLKERLEKVNQKIKAMEKPIQPLITSSMDRISELISDAEPILSGKTQVKPPSTPSMKN